MSREIAAYAIAHVGRVFGFPIDSKEMRTKAFDAYEICLSQPFDKKRASAWKEAFFNELQRQVNAHRKAQKAA